MSIAITADLHLTSRAEHPHRFEALEDMLEQVLKENINTLVIAGDLFHENRRDFHEFESLLNSSLFRLIRVVVIPGNHDPYLKQNSFSNPNIQVVSKPQWLNVDDPGLPFLFLPYKSGISAGDQLALFREEIPSREFVLVSHGDYVTGKQPPNPMERGIYMPLTRTDLETYLPIRVFLGHTHIPFELNRITSPGSPAAMDPSETGRRSFCIYNPVTNLIERRTISRGPIYIQDKILVFPSENSTDLIRDDIHRKIMSWGITESELNRVLLQLKFSGCSPNKVHLKEVIRDALSGFTLFPSGEPDLSEVLAEDDPALAGVVELALKKAGDLSLTDTEGNPELTEIQRAIFRLVYGE